MGLLTNLLLAPVTLPVRGINFVFREIHDAVERELNDPRRHPPGAAGAAAPP